MQSHLDQELIKAASDVIKERYDANRHVVGAALRLKTGKIVTGVHLEATIGRIAICAEAVAIGRAVTEHGGEEIEMLVAVYHPGDSDPIVCSPCGMCRELMIDYAPSADVLLAASDGSVQRVAVSDLLPSPYQRVGGAGAFPRASPIHT